VEREQLLERALSLAEEADWEGVVALLADRLEDLDEDPAVHCWLGVAERELGNHGVAYDHFKRALALSPDDPYVLATSGNGVAAFDDPDAEQALRTAALTAPDVFVARLLYGAYLAREGLLEEAARELEAARRLEPEDPQGLYESGVLAALGERWEEAVDFLADSVRSDPDDGWVRTMLGLLLLEDGRLEEAAGELMEGARLREEDVEAQLLAALAAAAIGRDGTAFEMVERARIRSIEGDVALIASVEERVDAGPDDAERMLTEDLAPAMLRERLRERP